MGKILKNVSKKEALSKLNQEIKRFDNLLWLGVPSFNYKKDKDVWREILKTKRNIVKKLKEVKTRIIKYD